MAAPKGNTHAVGHGAPTKYRSEYDDLAYKYCLLGATNDDLANYFEVDLSTVSKWIHDIDSFSDSVKNGREVADSTVAKRLYERAIGYEHEYEDVRVIDGEIVKTTLTKVYPPDTAAAFIWLKNRQRDKWRDRQEIEHSGRIDRNSSDEELDAIIQRFESRDSSKASKDN